jgi:hypothetical protein
MVLDSMIRRTSNEERISNFTGLDEGYFHAWYANFRLGPAKSTRKTGAYADLEASGALGDSCW